MSVDPITASLTVKLIETCLKPTLEKLRDRFSLQADVLIDLFTNSFVDYLDRGYEKYLYLPTIVFPNQKKLLKSLYIPLRISTNTDPTDIFLVNEYPKELFAKYKDILVVDTAGMGVIPPLITAVKSRG